MNFLRGLCVFLVSSCSIFLSSCAELQELRQRVELQDQEIEKLHKQNAEFQNSYEELKQSKTAEANALNARVESLQHELDKAKNERSERERKLDEDLHKQGLEAKATGEDLNARLNKANESATKLQTQLDQLTSDRAKDQEALGKIDAESKSLKVQLESQKKAVSDADARLKGEQKSSGDAMQKLAAAQEENKKLKDQIAGLKGEGAKISAPEKDPELQKSVKEIAERIKKFESAKGIEAKLDSRGLRIIIPSDSIFNKGSVLIADPIKPVLLEFAEAVKSLPGRIVKIEGHTDNEPIIDLPFADNWGLGAARADRVRQFLTEEGKVESDRIELITRAHYDPIAEKKNPDAHAKNRRVEIVIGAPMK